MKQITMLGLALAACVGLFAAPAAAAAEAKVKVTATSSGNTITVTVEVEGLEEGQKWKDIHFFPQATKSFPGLEGTNVPVGPPGTPQQDRQTWTSKGSGGQRINVYADGEAGFGNGTYDFGLTLKGDPNDWTSTNTHWKTTGDGNSNHNDGVIDEAGNESLPDFPQVNMIIGDGIEEIIATGLVNEVTILTTPALEGSPYQIYSSASLNEEFEDELAIGINSVTDPVPAAWNLVFRPFTGLVDANGSASPLPAVEVPDDPGLVGEQFFVVFAIMDGQDVLYASAPLRVRIQAP